MLLIVILGLAAAGCAGEGPAPNAALELELDLPPSSGTLQHAVVQIRSAAMNPPCVDWDGRDLEPTVLAVAERTVDHISVLSSDDSIDVNLKVRFCEDPRCNSFADADAPAVWFAIEHPFYLRERTRWGARIDTVPTGPPCDAATCRDNPSACTATAIDRCQIRGCVTGDPASSYCTMDGAHFCER